MCTCVLHVRVCLFLLEEYKPRSEKAGSWSIYVSAKFSYACLTYKVLLLALMGTYNTWYINPINLPKGKKRISNSEIHLDPKVLDEGLWSYIYKCT